MTDKIEFIELLQTIDPTEIEVIKTILADADIKHYFKGQALGRIFPTINKPVRLMVEMGKLVQARALLAGHGNE